MSACPPPNAQRFRTPFVLEALQRAYAELPPEPFYEWAGDHVWIGEKDAAEPGFYRAEKTPWTRRLQDLDRHPFRYVFDFRAGRWIRVRISLIAVQKSSRTGYTEAAFNGLRWRAVHRPVNYIFAIDTDKQAKVVASRVLRSLKDLRNLKASIFTGNPDDLRTADFELAGMLVNFYGSGSPGNFANKPAGRCLIDEYDEHIPVKGDTSTCRNLLSRIKDHAEGLLIVLSKPQLENGPINTEFKTGNCEEFFCPCPHCGTYQPLTFDSEEMDTEFDFSQPLQPAEGSGVRGQESAEAPESGTGFQPVAQGERPGAEPALSDSCPLTPDSSSEARPRYDPLKTWLPQPLPQGQKAKLKTGMLVFKHCKQMVTGEWDKVMLEQGQAFYQCSNPACVEGPNKGVIAESWKPWMAARGVWLPLLHGDPSTVSQHMHDLLSLEVKSTWGTIIQEFLKALKGGEVELQGFLNNRLGKTRKVAANKTMIQDIERNIAGHDDKTHARKCVPYKRGDLPFAPSLVILGADIGLAYARWAVGAVHENFEDVAIIDWGNVTGPNVIAEIMESRIFALASDPKRRWPIHLGFMDAHYRTDDARKACLAVYKARRKHNLIPTSGLGGLAARRCEMTYSQVPNYPKGFKHLSYRDQEALTELYVTRIHNMQRRLFFPVDVMKHDPYRDDPNASFPHELCGEELLVPPGGAPHFADPAPRPNHYGDTVKEITTGLTMLTRLKTGTLNQPEEEPARA